MVPVVSFCDYQNSSKKVELEVQKSLIILQNYQRSLKFFSAVKYEVDHEVMNADKFY